MILTSMLPLGKYVSSYLLNYVKSCLHFTLLRVVIQRRTFTEKINTTMFSKLMQLSSSHARLLDNLGIEIDKAIDDVKEFIRTIVYSANKSE